MMTPPEPSSPDEHRFLSLSMLLMHDHPRVGASFLQVHHGEATPYVKGWNVVPEQPGLTRTCWVFIGDEGGQTVWREPDVDGANIHVVEYVPPALDATTAYTWISRLAPRHSSPTWANQTISSVLTASHRGFPADLDAERDAVVNALNDLARRRTSLKSATDLATFIVECMLPYKLLQQSGDITTAILAATLMKLANVLSSDVSTHLRLRDVIGNRVAQLLDARKGKKPSGFLHATYLASLYGKVALMLSIMIQSQFDLQPRDKRLLDAQDTNVDELLAHYVTPHFVWFSMPTLEAMLRIGEQRWESLTRDYGDFKGAGFEFDAKDFERFGPCEVSFLQRAVQALVAGEW